MFRHLFWPGPARGRRSSGRALHSTVLPLPPLWHSPSGHVLQSSAGGGPGQRRLSRHQARHHQGQGQPAEGLGE